MSHEHLCRCGIPVRNCLDTIACEARILRARVAQLAGELEGMRERARAAEAQRDEAVSLAHESLTESVRAKADAARLREALEALVEYERKRHPPKMGGDHLPPTLREVMDIARAALASAPSAAAVVAKAVGT